MSLLNTFRQRASCRPRLSLHSLTLPRHVVSPLTLRPQWLQPTSKRLASEAATAARNPPKYPSKINIYRAGVPLTLFTGFLRLSTLVLFTIGTFLMAPTYLFSPTHSILWVPTLILGSAIPMSVAIFATGPLIHAITLHLPTHARRSVGELKRFADSPPGDTVLTLTFMRLAPWMTSKEVRLGRLRRITPSLRGGSANLEYVPEHVVKESGTVWFWLVQGFWGRYYVKRDQVRDRAGVPGVLDKLWEQIPLERTKGDPLVRSRARDEQGERKVVRMSGRPGVMSGREDVSRRAMVPPPPPPPPGGGRKGE